ncbi:MAG: hypothetical protein ACLQKA_10365 [Bryobacteraceae bacterium]
MSEEPRLPAGLVRRLPATFGAALHDQLRQWEFLFPAERRQLRAQLDWLSSLAPAEFDSLFAPLTELEGRMALGLRDTSAGLGVREVGILARSPLYPQWRIAVAKVFDQIDAAAAPSVALRDSPRLLLAVLPPAALLEDQPVWPELTKLGSWFSLDRPFADILPALAAGIAGRASAQAFEEVERTWLFECGTQFAALPNSTVLSWDATDMLRREFLRHFNAVQRDLRSVDQTSEDLRRADIDRLAGPAIAANPRVREFLRSVLLSGNGSLVFSNSFIEWGASEALRRVQPQALIASFGMRQKLKPFSSLVLFEDQRRSNPVPDQDDPAGSLTDTVLLAEYVYLASQRVACYPDHTVTLLSAVDWNRVLILAPHAPQIAASPATPGQLTAFVLGWLAA